MKTVSWTGAAAAGYVTSESIPLLALTDEGFYHRKLHWTLRFPMPPPTLPPLLADSPPPLPPDKVPILRSAEALEGALRLAALFCYGNDATHVLFNSPFLRLSDLSVLRSLRIPPLQDPTPPEHSVVELA